MTRWTPLALLLMVACPKVEPVSSAADAAASRGAGATPITDTGSALRGGDRPTTTPDASLPADASSDAADGPDAQLGPGRGLDVPSARGSQDAPTAGRSRAPAAALEAGAVARGARVFEQRCDSCHPDAEEDQGPRLRGRGFRSARLVEQVRNGSRRMRAIPPSRLSDARLQDLLAYLRSIGAVR